MKVSDRIWKQIEDHLKSDDRSVLHLGSTEPHAGLNLSVDFILAERVAAEPLGMPVFPVVPYGLTPYFTTIPARSR